MKGQVHFDLFIHNSKGLAFIFQCLTMLVVRLQTRTTTTIYSKSVVKQNFVVAF
ncbi:Uncharacterized protein APZ42_014376 [Daphnia magna]|uniref:Uncharacterized protein n=1 Tax=Daphnia magna TaxID=35525 RepID=A0A162PYB4_9CRUS|nr:Uncharacterized protein APZ42_014376 [Daphnia magna]